MTSYVPSRYQRNFENSIPFSTVNYCAKLAATTVLTCSVPGNSSQKFRVKFSANYSAEIWVCYGGTAAIPADGTGSLVANQEILPLNETRVVQGGTTLTFISSSTPQFSAQFLLLEDNTNG